MREGHRMGGAGRGRGKRKKNSDEEDGGEDVEGPTGTRRLTARQQAMEARLREEREGGPKPAFILLPRCCAPCKAPSSICVLPLSALRLSVYVYWTHGKHIPQMHRHRCVCKVVGLAAVLQLLAKVFLYPTKPVSS